jgi:hypothetical protein
VVRTLCASLAEQGRDFRMFRWDDQDRAMLLDARAEASFRDWQSAMRRESQGFLSTRLGKRLRRVSKRAPHDSQLLLFTGQRVLLPEVNATTRRAELYPALCESAAIDLGMIVYDFIPVFHPEFCVEGIRATFPSFLSLLRHADRIVPISRAVATELDGVLAAVPRHQREAPAIRVIPLAGDFALSPSGSNRGSHPPSASDLRSRSASARSSRARTAGASCAPRCRQCARVTASNSSSRAIADGSRATFATKSPPITARAFRSRSGST